MITASVAGSLDRPQTKWRKSCRSSSPYPSSTCQRNRTGALDSESGKVVMDVFRRLNEDSGVTILMVTHDPSVAEQTGRTIRIADGSLQQEAEA